MIYLDNAATTLIKPASVQREMFRAMSLAASPGRGGHKPAFYAADIVLNCREKAAALFNVSEPDNVVFTMNATHALNIAISSLAVKGCRVLVSGYEHNSVTRPVEASGAEIMIAQSSLFDRDSMLEEFRKKIPLADLVVCTHVSNVFGFTLPIYEIADICREYKVPLIIDASQSAGILELDFEKLGAEFIAMPGHKALFGPQGTGILLCRDKCRPLIHGGSGSDSRLQRMPDFLPDRLEAGTHNVPGIAGLAAGIDYVLECGIENIKKHEDELLDYTVKKLSKLESLELFVGDRCTQTGVLSFRSKKLGAEELGYLLAENGICVRSGLHCAPYAHYSAGTLESGTVRVSFSPFITLENAHDFCEILQNLL